MIHLCVLTLLCLLIRCHQCSASVWQENLVPKIRIKPEDGDVQKFEGNSSHPDYFKLLVQDGESLLIGSRNIVYNISLINLQVSHTLFSFANGKSSL